MSEGSRGRTLPDVATYGACPPTTAASRGSAPGVARRESTKPRNPIEVSPRASWAGMSVSGSVWVGMGVSVLGPVHQFGSMDDVPLGVVQVGQRRREQPVLLAIDVVVQQGDHRLDPGQVARGDGVEVGVQFVVFGAQRCDVFGEPVSYTHLT